MLHQASAFCTVVVWYVSILLLSACSPAQHKVRVGPDVRADIVVLFVPDASSEAIETFWHQVLQSKRPDGRGYEFRLGVMSALRCPRLDGHEAIAVNFHPSAVQAQRDELMRNVEASPLVYMTFQDAVPLEIHGDR
jgi:hypothetical protein